jgi:Tfp pilus assembly protein PilF
MDEAVRCYKEALKVLSISSSSPNVNQQTAHISGSLGICLIKTNKIPDGRKYLQKATKLL